MKNKELISVNFNHTNMRLNKEIWNELSQR
jgi:hypothetical protein